MDLRGRKRALAAALAILVLAPCAGSAPAQAAAPAADAFSFTYPSSQGSLNTTQTGDKTVQGLNAAGYATFDAVNKSAATSLSSSYAGTDAIWAFAGHARPGALLFWNGSALTEVWAEAGIPSFGYSHSTLRATAGLGDVRLMVFQGCETAKDTSNAGSLLDRGNLLYNAYYSRKVDSAIGFRGDIFTPYYLDWAWEFYGALKSGKTVSSSALTASNWLEYHYLNPGGFDTYSTMNGATKIVPAAYGS
jgi:hypothetical protein